MGDRTDSPAIRLAEGELAKLIRMSSRENYLDLNWLIGGCELRDTPDNQWAMVELAKMRGIETGATHEH